MARWEKLRKEKKTNSYIRSRSEDIKRRNIVIE